MTKRRTAGGKDFSSTNQPKNRYKGVPAEVREAMRLNNAKLQELIDKYLVMDIKDLKKIIRAEGTALNVIMARIVNEASKGGLGYIALLFDRAAGKPKEEIDITAILTKQMNDMSDADFADNAERAVTYLRSIK